MSRLPASTVLSAGAAALLSGTALAQDSTPGVQTGEPDVMAAPDNSWISVSGEDAAAGPDRFTLDYGAGLIAVEMDDYDPGADAAPLAAGDEVTVYGHVDDDFYEMRTIEASSVYNADTNTFHYASPADEDLDMVLYSYPAVAWAGPGVTVSGIVQSVDGREFVLDHALGYDIEVDTASMDYNPLDDEGVQQIDAGDRVSVSGTIDEGFFDNTELSADSILVLETLDE